MKTRLPNLGALALRVKDGMRLSPAVRKLIKAGNAARDRRDWPLAVKCYGEVLEAEPSVHFIAVQLGHALKEIGHYDKADQQYRSALALTPDNDDLYLQLGHLEKKRGNPEAALDYYRRAIELNPKNADALAEFHALAGTSGETEGEASAAPDPQHSGNGAEPGVGGNGRWNLMPKRSNTWRTTAGALRARGNRARDARRWTDAARAYEEYLQRVPNDAGIWAQLGHSLKESGDLEGGEAAYRTGLSIEPASADLYLHLGHALKLQKRLDEAADAYRRSFERVPAKGPYDELTWLRAAIPEAPFANARERAGMTEIVYFEIGDLLNYTRFHDTLSGIQRVQVGVIQYVLELLRTKPGRFGFVFGSAGYDGFWRIEPNDLKRLVDHCLGDTVFMPRQIQMIDRLQQNSILVRPVAGQCYFVLGAFWAFNGDPARYSRLKEAGVVIGAYIYDLIPLTNPELCDLPMVNAFTLAVGEGFAVFDFVLTISEFTAVAARRLLEKHDLRRLPVQAVPLAHLMQEKKHAAAPWSGEIAPLEHRPFVLYVATIEPRKNHAYLMTIWKRFVDEGLDPPDLVFVGRYGWRMTDFVEQLEASRYMGGRVHILHGLSDAELERLYQSCLFTVFPSVVEGWGLPVGESLAHGRPCIASNAASIPEVGGDLVDYVDPYNLREGIEVFRRMAFDADYRARREQDVRERFVARTWHDVAGDVLGSITRLRQVDVDTRPATKLLPGEMFRPADLSDGRLMPANYPTHPLRLIMVEGWGLAEETGAWMRSDLGLLRFQTDLRPQTEVVVYLGLVGAKGAGDRAVDIHVGPRAGGHAATQPALDRGKGVRAAPKQFPRKAASSLGPFPIIPGRVFLCHAAGQVADDGTMSVHVALVGPAEPASTEKHGVGLVCLAYAETTDTTVRMAILESVAQGEADLGSGETKKPSAATPK